MHTNRLWLLAAALVAAVFCSGWFVVHTLQGRELRGALDRAVRELDSGHVATAHAELKSLANRHPQDGETWYRLGLCEKARGNVSAALAAWARVPTGSPYSAKSTVARARLLLDLGKLSEADRLLAGVPHDTPDYRQSLEFLLRIEGRTADVRESILEFWPTATDRPTLLRRLYNLDHSAYPAAYLASMLARDAAGDPGVALGRGNFDLMAGRFADARQRLEASREKAPNQPALWRAWLNLAQAEGDVSAFLEAARHLPAPRAEDTEPLRLRAWLASKSGNPQLEMEAYQALVAAEPGDTAAWDRLAELALARGDRTSFESYRRKKMEANALRSRYDTLVMKQSGTPPAEELAELAEKLGRTVEARGWRSIARNEAHPAPLVVENRSSNAATLYDRLADVAANIRPGSSATTQTSSVLFADDASKAGISFVYDNGHTHRNPPPPEAMGGGVALLDYDGDGWLDVYLVQGGSFPPSSASPNGGDRLFRNKGDGSFEDVTERSGIAAFPRGYGHGVTVGDYDNDGKPDLFITHWRSYALYRNRGDGSFEDVTLAAGLGGDRDWPTSAAFADLDGDGDLDLYVCHYLAYDEHNPRRCEHPDDPGRHDCNPLDFNPLPDHAFRNDGGKFIDVTEEAGLSERSGRGLGVVATDLDGDGKVDLYVANDMSANFLYRNLGGFKFEEVGLIAGAGASASGGYKAGMGIACGDLDGDGLVDLAVTNYFGESTTFYKNLGGGFFADRSEAVGITAPTRLLLGFGITFLDADNDGRSDVLTANGHVTDGRPKFPLAMPLQILTQNGSGRLSDASPTAGDPFGPLHLARGLAIGDLDHDGRPDALAVCQNEPVVFLHNRTPQAGHFAVFRLEGTTSNRDAIGATVTVTAEDRKWVLPRFGGGSYLSAADPRLHVGLGNMSKIDSVEVHWPSGRTERLTGLAVDTAYLIREGEGKTRPLPGWTSPAGTATSAIQPR